MGTIIDATMAVFSLCISMVEQRKSPEVWRTNSSDQASPPWIAGGGNHIAANASVDEVDDGRW